jgi:Protein of unknown function (DUF2501)
MRHFRYLAVVTVCSIGVFCAAPVFAQSLPGMGSGSSMSGAANSLMGGSGSGAMGSMLPSLSSSSTGNVAGVLSYCVKNNIVQGSSATGALSGLTGQSGVTSSSGYAAGEQGNIQSGSGSEFSLGSASDQIKTKACNMVLQHAQSLL